MTVTAPTAKLAVPVFVTVIVCAADVVLVFWFPKVSDVPLSDSAGAVPVPLTLTMLGDPPALCAIETVAVFAPVVVGVNVTLIVQVAVGAMAAQPAAGK